MPQGERKLWMVADDLSGAADCAAGFAGAFGPVAVVLGDVTPASTTLALDTDSRAMPSEDAAAAVARAFGRIPCEDRPLVYKKIDSTLRGHVAAELRAALDAAPQFAGAVVAPSFPEQGRTLSGGKLWLQGRPVAGAAGDLMAMLAAAGLRPALLQPLANAVQMRQAIEQAIAGGARAVVVDAASSDDLAQLAQAVLAPAPAPWLLAGSAGLARALARHFAPQTGSGQAVRLMGGPVLALVGSFSPASASQVRQLETSDAAQVIRLDATQWLAQTAVARAVAAAHEALRSGRHVVLAISGAVAQPFSRELVQAMARAATALLPDAGTCVLTGGDTARALFDQLGVNQLEVIGEWEPGISLARVAASGAPRFVLKAGGFGDDHALRRIIAYFGGSRRATTAREAAPSFREQNNMQPPIVLITMGDPTGVGPEVIVKSVNQPAVRERLRPLVIGDTRRLQKAVQLTGVKLAVRTVRKPEDARFAPGSIDCLDLDLVPSDLPFGRLSAVGGEAAYRFIAKAVEVAQSGFAGAICTAPLNKEALHAAGHRYPGHTEMLAYLSGTPEVSMLLVAPRLRVIHVTTHIGLLDAVARIEPGLVERTIRRGNELLVRAGIAAPRIAVCGINPHAGEGGLFGRGEEAEKIAPAVAACVDSGLDVQGPLPADTLFFRATRGDFDLVVAMYHDQGHGPVKVLGLEAGVNVTVGLPFVRTSVDHGTAFDIAGTGRADAGSMVAALALAADYSPKAAA